jgi:hypothetical protein
VAERIGYIGSVPPGLPSLMNHVIGTLVRVSV